MPASATDSSCGCSTPEGAKIKVKAMFTERVARGVAFLPFHFAGWFQGEDRRSKYPKGADPIVLGEAANTAMTYGYDSVTQMQESKCQPVSTSRRRKEKVTNGTYEIPL